MTKAFFSLAAFAAATFFAQAEIQIINGQKYECRDGMCMPVDDEPDDEPGGEEAAPEELPAEQTPDEAAGVVCEGGVCRMAEPPDDVKEAFGGGKASAAETPRLAQGYMGVDEFVAFLENREGPSALEGKGWWLVLAIVLFGGLCMNLTPCVLPMVPVNLMIIGRSASRGALYGLGIALAYGVLGVLAAVGGMAFGEIQSSPWFNAVIAVLFFVLALALLGVFFIDFSKRRNSLASMRESMWPGLFAFFMGVVGAVLAGACVAPILISVLLLTASLFAKGVYAALALPFVLGLGMALPWPFAGAGLKALPKPGAWMTKVNKIFGAVVLCFAAWYAVLAWRGFTGSGADGSAAAEGAVVISSPSSFSLDGLKRPVMVDCWASWCKNCSAMDATTLADERVRKALERFTTVRLQAEDIKALKATPGFEKVAGLPAYLIFE